MCGRLAGWPLGIAVSLSATYAHAADTGIATRLNYGRSEAAQDCPDESQLRDAVRKRLGYNPFFPTARQTLMVEILAIEQSLVGRVRLVDSEGIIRGQRELTETQGNCGELVSALALAISITLDPAVSLLFAEPPQVAPEPDASSELPESADSGARTDTHEEAAEPAPPVANAPPQAPSQAPPRNTAKRAPPSKKPSRFEFAVRAGVPIAFGVAPKPVAGLRGGGEVRLGNASLILEGFDTFSSSRRSQSGGRVRVEQYGISLAPCWSMEWFLGCGLVNYGAFSAEGDEVAAPRSEVRRYAAVGGRTELQLPIMGAWSLLLNAELNKTLTPLSLRLHNAEVWAAPGVSGALGAGASFHFQ